MKPYQSQSAASLCQNKYRFQAAGRPVFLKALGIVVTLIAVFASANGQRNWSEYKQWCESQDGIAYPNPPRCVPRSSSGGGNSPVNPVNSEAEAEAAAARAAAERRKADLAARKRKASAADQRGLEAATRGSWKEAAACFMEALALDPQSREIRAHLDRANLAIADEGAAAEILALRQRIEDSIMAANLAALREKVEDDLIARRIAVMAERFRSQVDNDRRESLAFRNGGTQVMYPVLVRSVSANSPPAKVLAQNQEKVRNVDQEIRRAQVALRRIIESNTQSEAERLEWTRESEEATIDAQDLSISLVLDLIDAHVDHLTVTSNNERAEVLSHLFSRTGQENSVHSAYGMLLNRKAELLRLKSEVRLAQKEHDLDIKITDFSIYKDTEISKENVWDVFTNLFKPVDDLAGPYKDLVDAAYTIYRQAASFNRLAEIRSNQEKTLQAAAVLRRCIVSLVAERKTSPKLRPSRHRQ